MINKIIPTPKSVEVVEGNVLIPFSVDTTVDEWDEYTKTLSCSFEKLFGKPLERAGGGIVLKRDNSLKPKSYRLDSRDGVVLSASDNEGILYAMATLLQMAGVSRGNISVQKAVIEDYPEKDYRGLMIDLARQYHPVSTILKYIDLCFILKIKYLQLHFNDDDVYTLPSKAFPNLNRKRSYSYEEIDSICRRADSRGIIIVPELDIPGHANALNNSYPEIFANEYDGYSDGSDVFSGHALICAGKKKTMDAIKMLITEICELFPKSPYIHIGGDEANVRAWNFCIHCKAYMEKNGIDDVYELYSEFVGRVAKTVLDTGRTPVVWEGFPKNGIRYIPKQTIVIAWESKYHLAPDLIEAGFRVINSSWKPLYIVPTFKLDVSWGVSDILAWNVYNWQHWWQRSQVTLNPINVAPTEQVMGAQLCVWECTFEQEISRTMEHLAALSERTWTVRRLWGDAQFKDRARHIEKRIADYIRDVPI